ncbi:MAG: ribosomal-protein-alanine N-acetyltransferase [Methylophaga sp.]|nr:MAG: ribosomal-protein-alanine N-acetyltransferase [Methylophaga sp.]
MQPQDIPEVAAIEQDANQFPWSIKNFEDCLKAGHQSRVFFNEATEMLGYTIIQKVVDEAHLLNICVKPSVQGQGFGREILNYVVEFSKNSALVLIVLEVRSSNQRAQTLYLQAGFNEMSVRHNYYPAKQGREDAVLMGLDLSFLV